MNPFSIVSSINLSFYAIWALFFFLIVNRPELIPLFTSLQAAINLLAAGVFHLDRKAAIRNAFLIYALVTVAITLLGYYILSLYREEIGFEEGFTSMIDWAGPLLG